MRPTRWVPWLAVLVGCGRCGGCGGDAAIAQLTAVHGDVRADDAVAPVQFEPTTLGRRFVVGEAVRTAENATARLALAGGGTLRVSPESIVRFQRHADTARLDVERGSTEVEAPATAPLEIETVFGVTHLDAATRARFGTDEGRLEIIVGHATVERAGAAPVPLGPGAAVTTLGLVTAAETPRARDAGPRATPDAGAPRGVDGVGGVDAGGAAQPTRAVEVRGAGATLLAPGDVDFSALAAGHHDVTEGSVLRADEGTSLEIRTDDGLVHVDGAAEVALTPGAARARHGRFHLEGGRRTRLALPGGSLVLAGEAGESRADVEVARDGTGMITVRRGEAVHETADGARTLHAPDTAPLAAPTGATPRGHDAGGGDGAPPDTDPGAGALTLRAGETAVVHDPRAPTRVRLEGPDGCAHATWRIDGRAIAGSGAVVVSLRPGSHAVEARCSDALPLRSAVRVDRDAGRASVPRTAPRNVLDADGRTYSLLYQSLLPEVVVRWPHASPAGTFDVEVRHGNAVRTLHATAPTITFSSGQLDEGTHVVTFRSADGSRSPPTTVRIRFDNATPVATIRSPLPGAPLAASVLVEGVIAEQGRVSVAGQAVAVDGASHFRADVPLGPGGCVAIRVAVASRGVHYFLRCRD